MLERDYQSKLIKRINTRFLGCVIQKLDTGYQQGIPDLLILWGPNWAILEVKRKPPKASDFEPNQEWWIDRFDKMSFSACIYPENEEEILDAMESAFESRGAARLS